MAFGDITVTLRPIKFAFLVNRHPTPSSRPGPAPPAPRALREPLSHSPVVTGCSW
jgi:hypothetical protein